ncbi:hypothetical protein GWI33_019748 [Rhynchophorus ferrugineus]|uniref:Salivary secreted peptide n=1 Tax=Rhynchophorus ferrugineus TaxID=354439 RepID=A0A834HS29_RHYFE|nr:hypothetical protein GWI33_019748 [Rhynchophorus ferrugineus]
MRSIFVILFLIGVISATPAVHTNKLNNTSGNSIVEGNCTGANEEHLLHSEEVTRLGVWFVVRKATVNYNGNKIISCMEALNQKDSKTGGTVEIQTGGVGYDFVGIEMISHTGHGLDFQIKIYGN